MTREITSQIIVIDFGGQYAHLISRRVRDLGVFSEVVGWNEDIVLDRTSTKGIILSGSPRSVIEEGGAEMSPRLLELVKDSDLPILGLCYGHQLIALSLGGKVVSTSNREYGPMQVAWKADTALNAGVPEEINVWMSHGDQVVELPEGYKPIASGESCPIACYSDKNGRVFGLQFHPEVTHTEFGTEILANFMKRICKTETDWNAERALELIEEELRREVGDGNILVGVSGGVDSTVTATLLARLFPESTYAVFVDHGLMRHNEDEEVTRLFHEVLGFKHFIKVDAQDRFYSALEGVSDPEEKRRIIGHEFIDVFESEAKRIGAKAGEFHYLAQGTIYPDRVESAAIGTDSAKIKSHHNLTLPDLMELEIVEPLKNMYKDEVRTLGKTIGIPDEFIIRYPFPGPGLAIRVVGEFTKDRLSALRLADFIFREELKRAGLHRDIWQAFAALIPVKTVGVQGDARTYEQMIALRAVTSSDGMTADFARIPYEVLARISARIINETTGINRVVYDVSTKPPSTIEYE